MKKYLAGLAAVSVAGAVSPLLDNAQAAPQANGAYKVTADALNVRTGPSTSHAVTFRVYEGQILQVVGEENGWFKINHQGKTGYVSSEFVKSGGSSAPESNQVVQVASGNYIVNASSLRVRTGPSTSHAILGSLRKGEVVQVTGEEQNWFKINYGGKTGYISKDYVTKGGSNANTNSNGQQNSNVTVQTGGTYVVDTTSLRVRTGPATSHSVLGSVLKGQTLQVDGAENGWFKINLNGKTGYVSSEYVKFVSSGTTTQPETSNPSKATGDYHVNTNALNVRSGAGTNYGVIGALSKGIKVTVLSEQNGWSKIHYNGKTGYISSQYLSKTPASGESNTGNHTSAFIKPAAGSYTSAFGMRGGHMHYGIDIAASGTVPVVAAASGEVTRSYYSTSYGNVVFVTHNIKGETYTTVYAHLRSRSVSVGQKVTQGQQVGIMGNTGQSSGQHLHFEVHKGEWNIQKSNAVNPKLCIS
ncbi:SH3 domain-containing protein [Bacillus manliponensis]|uniref:SH3 domain-containing protein n=1 Tax=Bacillus manliponensis TaxID=574376 RepID=UPI0035171176